MPGLIDLHCHWIPAVDDGARTPEEGIEILTKLARLGFTQVVATPHMRPGMFDNSARDLELAFEHVLPALTRTGSATERLMDLPEVALSSEHYFDEIVLERISSQKALPYPGGKAILLEFYDVSFSPGVEQRLFELQRLGLTPVIAHPERYRFFWDYPERLQRLTDLGSVALLDACAVLGKYGTRVRRCAIELLDREIYAAACSDAHRPQDVDELERSMHWIGKRYGQDEVTYLLQEGPARVLQGARTN